MKKKIIFSGLLAALMFTSCIDDVVTRDLAQLPVPSQQFVKKNFPDLKVSYIKIDREWFYKEYKAVLTNGDELEFYSDGEWKEIECKLGVMPMGILIPQIQTYLLQNFPGESVKKAERKRKGFEVELTNKLEIIFDSEGNLMEIDD